MCSPSLLYGPTEWRRNNGDKTVPPGVDLLPDYATNLVGGSRAIFTTWFCGISQVELELRPLDGRRPPSDSVRPGKQGHIWANTMQLAGKCWYARA